MQNPVKFQPKFPEVSVYEVKTEDDLRQAVKLLRKSGHSVERKGNAIYVWRERTIVLTIGDHLLVSDNGFVSPSRDPKVTDGDFTNAHPGLFLPCFTLAHSWSTFW